MDGFPWDLTFTVLGVAVPVIAALYEFVFIGRKRLGYRVQMETSATDVLKSEHAGAFQQLRREMNGELSFSSLVLLRIENIGATHISANDYAAPEHVKAGITVEFPERRVVGMVITELSHDFLRDSFGEDSGLAVKDNVIELPKVPLNRGQHYKVLAALTSSESAQKFPEPKVIGGILGGVGTGEIKRTRAQERVPRRAIGLIAFLVVAMLGQATVSATSPRKPLDCTEGNLTVVGSTAFKPVLQEASDAYEAACPGAHIAVDTRGSEEGVNRLIATGQRDDGSAMLAFSEGKKGDRHPRLLRTPIALSLFTLVSDRSTGVENISIDDIRRIYQGEVTNWSQLGGANQPIRLISRLPNSGTRRTFEQRILGVLEGTHTSDDCTTRLPTAPPSEPAVRCNLPGTTQVLDTVADTPGAIGYAELGAAKARGNELFLIRINGNEATPDAADFGAYPFWETEYAYSFGEPEPVSLSASFLRYLTDEVGKDIAAKYDHRPCAELANPELCQPA